MIGFILGVICGGVLVFCLVRNGYVKVRKG